MFEHILVPLDGSYFATRALEPALRLATEMGAQLTLLSILDAQAREMLSDAGWSNPVEAMQAELEEIATRLSRRGAVATCRAVSGANAAEGIVEFADSNLVSMIIMSTHGRSGLSRWLLGSVAAKVVRHSPVPVLLIPAKYHEAA